jgi:ATP-dependent metalloprotease FtsH
VLLVLFGFLNPSPPPAKPEPAAVATTVQKAETTAASTTSPTSTARFTMADALATMGCAEVGCTVAATEVSSTPASNAPINDPVGDWVVQYRMAVIGLVILLVAGIWSYTNYADKREAERASKPFLPDQVELNGTTHKIPTLKSKNATLILPGDPRFKDLTFDKIIGQAVAKEEVLEILDFLQNPDKYKKVEADLPRGVLLYGAHGTGKTLLVRTLAALCGIPVLETAGSAFVNTFVGTGAATVRDLYADADALVKIFGACLVFIDEIDAVARARGGPNSNDERETTLNQLLVEMDGVVPRPRVLTFGASNRKDIMDPAALRPGRFDRQIEFFNPNRDERKQMMALYLPEHLRADGVDLGHAAKGTPTASGAHLKNIANEAKIMAARVNLDRVTADILDEAVQKVMHGARRDSQRAVLHADEIDTVKVHEAGHALLYWLRTGKAPLRFTVIPRGNSGGHVEFSEDFEMLRTQEHLLTRLIVLMGGYAATFIERGGQLDTGIGSDYQMATQLAAEMVCVHGMSKLGRLNLEVLSKIGLVSDALKERMVSEIDKLVEDAAATALQMLKDNRADLKKLIEVVGERETLLAADFEEVFIKPKQAAEVVVPFVRPTPPVYRNSDKPARASFGIPGFLRGLRRRRQGDERRKAAAE